MHWWLEEHGDRPAVHVLVQGVRVSAAENSDRASPLVTLADPEVDALRAEDAPTSLIGQL